MIRPIRFIRRIDPVKEIKAMQLVTKAGNFYTIDGCRIAQRPTSAMPGYYANDVLVNVPGTGEFAIASTKSSGYGYDKAIEIVSEDSLVAFRDRIVEALMAKEDQLDLRQKEEAATA